MSKAISFVTGVAAGAVLGVMWVMGMYLMDKDMDDDIWA